MKKCSSCEEKKTEQKFYRRSTGKLESRCKVCFIKAQQAGIERRKDKNIAAGNLLRLSTETKKCSRCEEHKTYFDFDRQNKNPDGHSFVCKECSKPYAKKYYELHRERKKEFGTTRWKMVRKTKREFYIEYLKSHPCVDCGNQNVLVLQADHLSGKTANISAMVSGTCGIQKMKDELLKCEIRCANCHQIKTAYQFGFWRTEYA